MKFKGFQAPVLFSSTFKALNLGEKNQVLSRMRGNPVNSEQCNISNSHHRISYGKLRVVDSAKHDAKSHFIATVDMMVTERDLVTSDNSKPGNHF